ncbi:MAG: hypothetical protein GY730_00665 [bacterium]|nr:hypothetical protein [bacterium]
MNSGFLNRILSAREKRQSLRISAGSSFITFNLNIPGYPKSSEYIKKAFVLLAEEVKMFFSTFFKVEEETGVDEAGHYMFIPVKEEDLKKLKKAALEFEENHVLGRLCDIDIYEKIGSSVSGSKKKKCFLCNEQAQICIKRKEHSIEELRGYCDQLLISYVKDKENNNIVDNLLYCVYSALLSEVSLHPKPGLVTRLSSGPHKDMNFFTFIKSSAVLMAGYRQMAFMALNENWTAEHRLNRMRMTGLKMEQEMLRVTHGVNTHKGAVFLLGLAIIASVRSIKDKGIIDYEFISSDIKDMTRDITAELKNIRINTHGALVFRDFGLAGARGEAEDGLPLVFNTGIPAARSIKSRLSGEELMTAVLTEIIHENNDTNIIYRGGIDHLNKVKEYAGQIIDAGFWNERSRLLYEDLCSYCNFHNLSCGGSADLLILTLYFLKLENIFGAE